MHAGQPRSHSGLPADRGEGKARGDVKGEAGELGDAGDGQGGGEGGGREVNAVDQGKVLKIEHRDELVPGRVEQPQGREGEGGEDGAGDWPCLCVGDRPNYNPPQAAVIIQNTSLTLFMKHQGSRAGGTLLFQNYYRLCSYHSLYTTTPSLIFLPRPKIFPNLNSPSQIESLAKISFPLPSISPFRSWPSYFFQMQGLPQVWQEQQTPHPSGSSSAHSPSYSILPLEKQRTPLPCIMLFFQLPSQQLRSLKMYLPLPCLSPCFFCPMYWLPFVYSSWMFQISSSSTLMVRMLEANTLLPPWELLEEYTDPTLLFFKLPASFYIYRELSFLITLSRREELPTADWRNMLGIRAQSSAKVGLLMVSIWSMSSRNFSILLPCLLPAILTKLVSSFSYRTFLLKWQAFRLGSIRHRSRMVIPKENTPLLGELPRLFFTKYDLNSSGARYTSWCSLLSAPLTIKHCRLLGPESNPESITFMVDSLDCTPTKMWAILTLLFALPALSIVAYPRMAEQRILVISSLSN